MLRLLFVADGRSPIALNWITYFIEAGHEVHLASTFSGAAPRGLASYTFLPVALSGLKGQPAAAPQQAAPQAAVKRSGVWGARLVGLRTLTRQWLGPLTLPSAARRLHELAAQLQPDIVHAMRIPYEGMLAALADLSAPLVVSVWGNDFTLHARSTPLMRRYTRLTLARAAALYSDCARDVRLARAWGFPTDRLAFVLPGAGGVQRAVFYPPERIVSAPVVIQPRGVRAYVQTQAFFEAVQLLARRCPEVQVLCPNMAGEAQAQRTVQELGIAANVRLLPAQTRPQMAELFRSARVVVSPTTHDGTPNTLLEALACGCLPVAGDLESIHEWIAPGENGLLVDPRDPQQLADAMLVALKDDALCARARAVNLDQISERADYERVMARAGEYYQLIQTMKGERINAE